MPSRETVAAFVAAVEGGDHVGAIERFYHGMVRRLDEVAL